MLRNRTRSWRKFARRPARLLSTVCVLSLMTAFTSSVGVAQSVRRDTGAAQPTPGTVRIRTTIWAPDGDSLRLTRSVESLSGPAAGDSVWDTRMGGVSATGLAAARAFMEADQVGSQLAELNAARQRSGAAGDAASRIRPPGAHEYPYDARTQRSGFWIRRERDGNLVIRTSVTELKGQLTQISTDMTREDGEHTLLLASIARTFSNGTLTRVAVIEYGGGRRLTSR